MATTSQHTDWLSLVETSGPFLTVQVLEQAFPQGLDSIETPKRQQLRSAYEEWREAVDEGDDLLPELHEAWINLVLTELLEYDAESLTSASSWVGELPSVCHHDTPTVFQPSQIVHSLGSFSPKLFIKITAPGARLNSAANSDGWLASEVERMTLLCRAHEVRLGLVTNGEEWVLVNAPLDSPSGQTIWHSRYWFQEPATLKAFHSLLGVRRCFGPTESTLESLLDESLKHQDEVTDTLGEQVRRATEVLIQALDKADEDRNRDLLRGVAPTTLYEAALTVMMRLVFVLCAEERDLFLLGDPTYDENMAVSTLRGQLAEEADQYGDEVLERRYDAWARLSSVFRAVYAGIEHEDLRLPAMGGSLFDPDRFPFLEGRPSGSSWLDTPSRPLPVDNRTVLLLLNSLQVLEHSHGALTLSYRALDVEQIGHVYEGLLEHTVVRVPETTLGLKGSAKNRYPALTLSEMESLLMDGTDSLAKRISGASGRSSATILGELGRAPSDTTVASVLTACGGDIHLAARLAGFANTIRADAWGDLLVYHQGSFMVTSGTERRETGTHYTPRALTEEIVKVTLDPLVKGDDGTLKTPRELLELKVCDPAMGSGAFLVEACRYLADKLVEAWAAAESVGKTITRNGQVLSSLGQAEPMPASGDERLLEARRLVAEQCLYGVDVNPLAVELSKLSIWLVTLAKGKPFGFLDHNLRTGDSLLGLHQTEQLVQLTIMPLNGIYQPGIFGQSVEEAMKTAIAKRSQIRETVVRDITDVQEIAALDREARHAVADIELIADCLVCEGVESQGASRAFEAARTLLASRAEFFLRGNQEQGDQIARRVQQLTTEALPSGSRPRNPFHWVLEFPEVARQGGFDAIVGNPPFLGNRLWKSALGDKMQSEVRQVLGTAPGKIDLCVAFHRRATALLRLGGCYGLIARDNVTEGSAIKVGLAVVAKEGDIFFARKGVPWPGNAAVVVSIIVFCKGQWNGKQFLNGSEVERIGPRLDDEARNTWTPKALKSAPFAFAGVDNSKGLAFILEPSNPWFTRLREEPDSLLRPYISGNDITDHSLQRVRRWALDISDHPLDEIHDKWPVAFAFLTEVVEPTRTRDSLKSYKGLIDRWWQFWNHRAAQMRTLRKRTEFIAFPKAAKFLYCLLAPTAWVYTNMVVLVELRREDQYALCLSSMFREWLHAFSVRGLGDNTKLMRLSISEAVATFPLPDMVVSEVGRSAASEFNSLVVSWAASGRGGMTDFLNSVHNPEENEELVTSAREALSVVDSEVSAAYGWSDLDLSAGFRDYLGSTESDQYRWSPSPTTLSVLVERLSMLNREVFEAEKLQKRGSKARIQLNQTTDPKLLLSERGAHD